MPGLTRDTARLTEETMACHGDACIPNLLGNADAHTAWFLTADGIGVNLPEQPGRLQEYRARWMGE